MTQTYFRVQPADRPTADLLEAGQQSHAWGREHLDDNTTRDGVSVCASREDLAQYLATYGAGIPYGLPGWVLVELSGDISDDQPLDAEGGELLVHPTEIVACAEIDEAFFEMVSDAYDAATA